MMSSQYNIFKFQNKHNNNFKLAIMYRQRHRLEFKNVIQLIIENRNKSILMSLMTKMFKVLQYLTCI